MVGSGSPGTSGAPAWVDWRFGGGYGGRVPLPPAGAFGGRGYRPRWCFVHGDHFLRPHPYTFRLPPEHVATAERTTVVLPPPLGEG